MVQVLLETIIQLQNLLVDLEPIALSRFHQFVKTALGPDTIPWIFYQTL